MRAPILPFKDKQSHILVNTLLCHNLLMRPIDQAYPYVA